MIEIKKIQGELFKDTPVKTEDNKPCIDNIDACNRDRALITKSLSDRLGLGQNSLLGAQQVRVATKHTRVWNQFVIFCYTRKLSTFHFFKKINNI